MLWKSRTTSVSNWTGLALGLTILPLVAGVAVADAALNSSVTAPSSTVIKAQGLKTAVVAATDTGGDIDVAMRALSAAHFAVARSTGYVLMPANEVAGSLQNSGIRWPFTPRQFPEARKKLKKADRALAVTVSPGAGGAATYSAVVEMYDLNTGGLVGRGESSYTATADSVAASGNRTAVVTTPTSQNLLGSFEVPAGTAGASPNVAPLPSQTTTVVVEDSVGVDPRFLAVDGAVLRAVAQMNEPAQITGIIISIPGGYTTRLSKGATQGLRNGARIEYTVGGRAIAYGTVIDVGKGETLATVAPERALPLLEINGEFRTVSNPVAGAAGLSRDEIDNREWKKFERDFGLSAGIAGLAYLLFIA